MDIEEEAEALIKTLGPDKSHARYEAAYRSYIKWISEKTASSSATTTAASEEKLISEQSLFVYFNHYYNVQKHAPSTLWPLFSMLRSTINKYHGVDIKKYTRLQLFIKKQNVGYVPKKASILTEEQIVKFLMNAPDDLYLLPKVAICLSLCGALRLQELYDLGPEDVVFNGEEIDVTLGKPTKNYVPRKYKIVNEGIFKPFDVLLKYNKMATQLGTKRTAFIMQIRNGKCTAQRVGKTSLADYCKSIARFLNLKDPQTYTSHCMRRTSSTLLANNGATNQQLQKLGGWKSMKAVNGYIESNDTMRRNTAKLIIKKANDVALSGAGPSNCLPTPPQQRQLTQREVPLPFAADNTLAVNTMADNPLAGWFGGQLQNCNIDIKIFHNTSPKKN